MGVDCYGVGTTIIHKEEQGRRNRDSAFQNRESEKRVVELVLGSTSTQKSYFSPQGFFKIHARRQTDFRID